MEENSIFDEDHRKASEDEKEAVLDSLKPNDYLVLSQTLSNRLEGKNILEQSNFKPKRITDSHKELKTECYRPHVRHNQDELIFGSDQRTKVENTEVWPHSAQGMVKIIEKDTGDHWWGTGTMIGPNFVLTAAHNLFRPDTKRRVQPSEIRFVPASNGPNITPFGIISVIAYEYDPVYESDIDEDYALLVLENEIHDKTGYIGLHACPIDILKEMIDRKYKFQLWGYPEEKNGEQWGMEGTLESITEKKIYYTSIATTSGQSGASIYYGSDHNFWIMAVHKGGEGWETNFGVRITKQRIMKILNWMESYLSVTCKNMSSSKTELTEYPPPLELIALLKRQYVKIWNLKLINTQKLPELLNNSEASKVLAKLTLKESRKDDATALAENVTWFHLHTLELSENNIGEDTAKLAQNPAWSNLHTLGLSLNKIGDVGATALAQNTVWTNLHTLQLWSNKIGDAGATALAKNTVWTNLRTLQLATNQIGYKGAAALAENTAWSNLHTLILASNKIGDKGAAALAKNTVWKNLHTIGLLRNGIGDVGAAALAQNTVWKKLHTVGLRLNQIGDEGAAELAKNTSWTNLRKLSLSWNNIGDEGTAALAQNRAWLHLTTLELQANSIGDGGIAALAQNTTWSDLKMLDLSENNFGDEGIAEFAQNIT